MTKPFLIIGLPRSRTAWLSRFLTYGDWICGHEQARHMRSLDDVKAWFSQPCMGTAETAIAPFWRMFGDVNLVIVRRKPADVVESLMRLPGVTFDRPVIERLIDRLDRKLDQIAVRVPGALQLTFDELNDEGFCARIFERCLPYRHDHDHWLRLAHLNVQCDMRAMMRYAHAYLPAMRKVAEVAKHKMLADMKPPIPADGITFQAEEFDTWLRDAESLIESHLVVVGEAPSDWRKKNLGLMRDLHAGGNLTVTTARSNGRMFGYLMTLVSPSLTGCGEAAYHTAFYASPDVPGLGMKLQHAAIGMLKERGVHELFFEAGQRGSGPRLGSLYRRLGAQEHGQVFRLELEAA